MKIILKAGREVKVKHVNDSHGDCYECIECSGQGVIEIDPTDEIEDDFIPCNICNGVGYFTEVDIEPAP